ncbi:uncharacterized protein [Palaemon carinicauda]|uniref:uncharacterized protein n=1 Tax=Palaemon carinicauda TaxID=392227 RepID=UPI0035B62011
MDTPRTVMASLREGDFMISIDLKDAYFQVPIHPASRKFLWVKWGAQVLQFKALCFGLSTAPQVFTRVFTTVSVWAHEWRIRLIRYRLATLFVLRGRLETAGRRPPAIVQKLGHHSQLGEISVDSNQQNDLLRNSPGFVTGQGLPIHRQAKQPGPSSPSLPSRSSQKSEGLAEVGRTSGVLRETSSTRETELKEGSMELKGKVEPEKFPGHSGSSPARDQTSLRVVAGSVTHSKRDATVRPASRNPSVYGCIEGRMGSASPGKDSERDLDRKREIPTHQCPGDESGPGSLQTLQGRLEREFGGPDVGQCNSGSIRKGGGTEIKGVVRSGPLDPGMGGKGENHPDSKIHSREEERPSRRPQQNRTSSSDGVVPAPTSGKLRHSDVGVHSNGSVWNKAERTTPRILFSCPRPKGGNGRRLSTQMGRPRRVRFSPLLPNKTSPQQGEGSNQPKDDFGSALVAGERVVRRPKESRHSPSLASSQQSRRIETTTFSAVPRKPTSPSSSRLEVIQRLLKRQGYSSKTARRMSLYLRKSSTAVYESKWTLFVKWCKDKKIEPLEASVPIIEDFLVHLRDKLAMSVPAIKGVRAALGQVFLLKGIDLGSSRHISMLIKAFEQSCPPSAPRIPNWDLARVLDMLRKPPFEPLKDIVDKNLKFKVVFLLALASAKRVGELHGLSYEVEHCRRWKEITFKFVPSFVAKTQNPRFESFTIPAIPNEGNQEDLKLCSVRVIRKYLKRTAKLRPSIKNLFVSWGKTKKIISKNTVSFWLRQVIMQAYSNEGISVPGKPRAHDVRDLSTSLAFEKNMSVAQVLRAGTWSNQSTFTAHYLKDCTRKSLDGFSIGPVISALHQV